MTPTIPAPVRHALHAVETALWFLAVTAWGTVAFALAFRVGWAIRAGIDGCQP